MQELVRFALLGFGLGAIYALVAHGLVLIYRGSGVLNFAQGAIGILGAYLEWELADKHGLPFPLAFAIGVTASASVGALTHLLVLRNLRRASGLARVVATLGVLVIVQSVVLQRYGPNVTVVVPHLPQSALHLWGVVSISADRLILVTIAAILSVALWLMYRRTRFGLATAAVAENQRAAAALGWSPDTIATVNWALGSALAGAAAILVAPITGLQATSMTNVTLAAMAVALVAGFRSFPVAFAAGMLIGIAQTLIAHYWATQPGADQALPLFVIVAFLVFTGRALPLRNFFLERLPVVGRGKVRRLPAAAGIAVATALIATVSPTWVGGLLVTFAFALILLSVVVLTGYAGQLSLAQFAIAGVGAYIAGRLVATQHVPFWAATVIAVGGTALAGALLALPAVRTRGTNLAVITFGLGTAIELVLFNNPSWTGSVFGTQVGSPRLFGWSIDPVLHERRYAFICLACFALAALAVANLRRGRTGRQLLAVRTNERAAAALGINVPAAKLYAFMLAAALAALGGILIAFQNQSIVYATTFPNFTSISVVAWAFLGGIGYVLGPVVGATFAAGAIGSTLSDQLFPGLGNWLDLIGGVAVILTLLANPDGIVPVTVANLRRLGRRLPAIARAPRDMRDPVPVPSRLAASGAPTAATPATVSVSGLTVRYGAVTAVDELTLTIAPGRIVGLIGPNGAGKTTVIDAITGFTAPGAGSVTLDGRDITSWPAARRARHGIARSFQSLELFEDGTVLENLRVAADRPSLSAYLRDLVAPSNPPLPGEVVAAIEDFGLADALHRTVQDLPYGHRRLVAIVRALAMRPSVLLLDEPAAGLSERESRELARLVRRLADHWGIGILLVEHDMSFVMATCDEVVVLDFGRTISAGRPDDVRSDAAVIAAYLGSAEAADGASSPSNSQFATTKESLQ